MKIRIEYDSGVTREFESSVKINDDRRILIETTDPKHGGEIFVIKSTTTKNITPPWLKFPSYQAGCAGFRMGAGEDYYDKWRDYWCGLEESEKIAILDSAPEEWKNHLT